MSRRIELDKDEPFFHWEFGGQKFRASVAGGAIRFECLTSRGDWVMIQPSWNECALMDGLHRIARRLERAETAILHLKGERFEREAAS